MRITTAFRLSKDPGASFALASSLDAAIGMADNLGFGGLAHVTKARPIIQAASATLLEVPEQARLKLANAQFGTPAAVDRRNEFPLLCCFTTEISDPAIVSRIVALRSFVLLRVAGWPFSHGRRCLALQLRIVSRQTGSPPRPFLRLDLVKELLDRNDSLGHRFGEALEIQMFDEFG